MGKIKPINDVNKIGPHQTEKEPFCNQWKEDVLFEFGHITGLKKYSCEALLNQAKNDKKILSAFFELISVISSSTWLDLSMRNKKTIGGFETMQLGELKAKICEAYNPYMTDDTKLHIFRFGSADSYRMIGYKSHNCSRTIHVLGFDLDFSLYNHE